MTHSIIKLKAAQNRGIACGKIGRAWRSFSLPESIGWVRVQVCHQVCLPLWAQWYNDAYLHCLSSPKSTWRLRVDKALSSKHAQLTRREASTSNRSTNTNWYISLEVAHMAKCTFVSAWKRRLNSQSNLSRGRISRRAFRTVDLAIYQSLTHWRTSFTRTLWS